MSKVITSEACSRSCLIDQSLFAKKGKLSLSIWLCKCIMGKKLPNLQLDRRSMRHYY